MNYLGTVKQQVVGTIIEHTIKLGMVSSGLTVIQYNGSTEVVNKIAGEAIGGHRVVYLFDQNTVAYANQTEYLEARKILGVTLGAASQGATIQVQTSGIVIEPSWTWVEGSVWLGLDGLLTQTAPTSGYLVSVGIAISATALQLDFDFIIKLT